MTRIFFLHFKEELALKCNGPHEHYSETTSRCEDKCVPVVRVCELPKINRPSCKCDSGYNRDPKTGECLICLLKG